VGAGRDGGAIVTAQFATPGPWQVTRDGDQWRIRQKGTVRRIAGGTLERPVGEGFNYRLDAVMAAEAPNLVKALESCVDWLDWLDDPRSGLGDNHKKVIKRARAAIAKARGEP